MAIDGKTSRRSHDRAAGAVPLHLVSAFATTARLVLAQEAVPDKANELAAIPLLLERLGAEDGLKGALVSIDATATNAMIARGIADQGADWLLAVKANQPTLRAELQAAFAEAGTREGDHLETHIDFDKGHGRIEKRRMAVLRDTGWLDGHRRSPQRIALAGSRLPAQGRDPGQARRCHPLANPILHLSRPLAAADAANAVREHWGSRTASTGSST